MVEGCAPWKQELVKIADRLEARTKQRRWASRTEYLIERDFALAAYALRRLISTGAEPVTQTRVPIRRFESADLDDGRRGTLSIEELCDEILHCAEFTFYCGETDDLFDGIYLTSDRNKNVSAYLLLASDFIALCGDVGIGLTQPS